MPEPRDRHLGRLLLTPAWQTEPAGSACRIRSYETHRNRRRTPTPPPPGRRARRAGRIPRRRRPLPRLRPLLRLHLGEARPRVARASSPPSPTPAPRPASTDAQLKELEGLLLQGAKAHGWRTELWTAARVAELIERHFEVALPPRARPQDPQAAAALDQPEAPEEGQGAGRGGHRPLKASGTAQDHPPGPATRGPPGLPRRVGLHAHPDGPPHLRPAGPDADPQELGPPRPDLGHQRRHRQPDAAAARPVLPPAARRRQRPRRGHGGVPARSCGGRCRCR